MKVFVLTISDRDMRPRCDMTTTVVFAKREDVLTAMEHDIVCAIENQLVSESEIERHPEMGYAVSTNNRFMWKIEELVVNGNENRA